MLNIKRLSSLKKVDSLALANAQLNLQKAYNYLFESRAEFPKFKSRKVRQLYTTHVVNGNIQLLDGLIQLPKLKRVKVKQHRDIPPHYTIKSCTISRTKTEKCYISILTEYQHPPIQKEIKNMVELDFSINGLFVDSEGKKANDPRFYHQALEKFVSANEVVGSSH